MTIANTEPRQIRPTHPGEMLREDFMPDYGLTASTLAAALGVSRQMIHELLREDRAITPPMALRLSRLFGNSPAFWLKRTTGQGPLGIGARLPRRIGAHSAAFCYGLTPETMHLRIQHIIEINGLQAAVWGCVGRRMRRWFQPG